jgi:hypothetical protein
VKKTRQNKKPKAFSSEVEAGLREENASEQRRESQIVIQSEPIRLQLS